MAWRSSPIMRTARSCAAVFSLIMPAVMTKMRPPVSFIFSTWPLSSTTRFKRFVQLQVGVLAVGAVRFQVVDFREDAAQAADVDRLRLEFAFAHQQGQQGEDFLGAPQGERRDEHGALALEDRWMACGQALDFRFAREAGRHLAVAARGFHDEHVGLHVFEPGRLREWSGRGNRRRRCRRGFPSGRAP